MVRRGQIGEDERKRFAERTATQLPHTSDRERRLWSDQQSRGQTQIATASDNRARNRIPK
jgi:hypothetical protein